MTLLRYDPDTRQVIRVTVPDEPAAPEKPTRVSQRPTLSDAHRERLRESIRRSWAEGGIRRVRPSARMGRPKNSLRRAMEARER